MSHTPASFVDSIRQHLAAGHRPHAIDVVFDTLDELLLARRFVEATAHIHEIVVSDLPILIHLSALTVTRPWCAELGWARVELAEAAYRLTERDGKLDTLLVKGLT